MPAASAPGRRKRDPATTRAALVRAAAEIFNEIRYHETDSNRIARAAGFSPGTFYRYFPDKRAIFLEAYDTWVTDEWEAVAELGRTVASPEEALERILDRFISTYRRFRVFRANLGMLSASDDEVRDRFSGTRRRQLDRVRELREQIGAPERPRAVDAVQMLVVERLCAAIADGEVGRLGVKQADVRAAMRDLLLRTF